MAKQYCYTAITYTILLLVLILLILCSTFVGVVQLIFVYIIPCLALALTERLSLPIKQQSLKEKGEKEIESIGTVTERIRMRVNDRERD